MNGLVKTDGLLQDEHIHCIKINIKKQTSFDMQAMFKQTSKNTNENAINKPMIAIVEETRLCMDFLILTNFCSLDA